jgi:hypothetical protein
VRAYVREFAWDLSKYVRYVREVRACVGGVDGRGTPKRGEGAITYLIYELLYQTWERGRKLKVGN